MARKSDITYTLHTEKSRDALFRDWSRRVFDPEDRSDGQVGVFVKEKSVDILTLYRGIITRRKMSFPKDVAQQALTTQGPVAEAVHLWFQHALNNSITAAINLHQRSRISKSRTEYSVSRPHSHVYGSFCIRIPRELELNEEWNEKVMEELICHAGTLNAFLCRGQFTLEMLKRVKLSEETILRRIEKLTTTLITQEK